jgi:hypothetical protein
MHLEEWFSPLMRIPEVHGILYFRDETTISAGIYANYNNDRVVFYDSDWNARDFKAYVCIFVVSPRSCVLIYPAPPF